MRSSRLKAAGSAQMLDPASPLISAGDLGARPGTRGFESGKRWRRNQPPLPKYKYLAPVNAQRNLEAVDNYVKSTRLGIAYMQRPAVKTADMSLHAARDWRSFVHHKKMQTESLSSYEGSGAYEDIEADPSMSTRELSRMRRQQRKKLQNHLKTVNSSLQSSTDRAQLFQQSIW